MPTESRSREAQPTGRRVRGLIIVARDQPDLWQSLREHFAANEDVTLVLDRRLWERRQRVQGCEPDRRGLDRRRPPSTEHDLRSRPFVIAGAKY
jgi:hypothetical protein